MTTDIDEETTEQIVRIGGTAMLLTSVLTAATVAIGRNQVAQRAEKDGVKDFKKMAEGSQLAMRALRRATMYNVIGFGGLITAGCYFGDIRSFQDFRLVAKSIRGVQISKEGAKPTTWEDIFPDEKKD